MLTAAQPETPIVRLVVNDIGPVIEPAALARIGSYVGVDPCSTALRSSRSMSARSRRPSGRSPMRNGSTCRAASHGRRRTAAGTYKYDPGIAVPFRTLDDAAGRPVAGMGRDPLSDAAAARRRLRPPVRAHGGGDDYPRSAPEIDRIPGSRPRADAAEQRSDHPRGSFFAGGTRLSLAKQGVSATIRCKRFNSNVMALALSLPPLEERPSNPPETRLAKVGPWLDDLLKRDPIEAARVIGDALAATNRVALSESKRLELAERYYASAQSLWPNLERQFSRAAHPLSGEALEAAKASLTLASELSTAYKHLLAHEADKRILLSGNRLLVALIHRCLQCTRPGADEQLPVVLAGAGAHLARRAPDLQVRVRPRPAPDAGGERQPGRHAGASLHSGAAARAGESLRLSSRTARPSPALPAGVLALGEDHRRRAGAPPGQGRRDRSARSRLSAVLREQGRQHRRQQIVPAHLRPCLPDPGAASLARRRRCRAAQRGQRARRRDAVHRAAAAPAAPMGHSAGAPVQPPSLARAGRDVCGPRCGLAVQPRHARAGDQRPRPDCRRCTHAR